MRFTPAVLLIALLLVTAGCVSGPRKVVTVSDDPKITATTMPANLPVSGGQNPIIGAWKNGMTFYANGSVGSDGITSWHTNGNAKNSYFVIRDEPSEFDRGRNITSTEWIYIPESDCIHRRGSPVLISRKAE